MRERYDNLIGGNSIAPVRGQQFAYPTLITRGQPCENRAIIVRSLSRVGDK